MVLVVYLTHFELKKIMKNVNRVVLPSILALSLFLTSCATVETGEIGLRKTFDGKIEPTELDQGFHQAVIGDVLVFSVKEILIDAKDLQPQTKDKTIMKDFDVRVTYSVDPASVAELYSKYSTSYHTQNPKTGEIYPMAAYVRPFIDSAVFKAVSEYPALDVSDSRSEIAVKIRENVVNALKDENLDGKLRITSVVVGSTQLPDELVASVNAVVTAQSELKAKEFEVQTAQKESERIAFLASKVDKNYVELIKAEALQEAAKNGSTIWVVPDNFNALGSMK
jgi:regulator of protease activity HflC (stomatin/prohibitin superfamily)